MCLEKTFTRSQDDTSHSAISRTGMLIAQSDYSEDYHTIAVVTCTVSWETGWNAACHVNYQRLEVAV